MMLIIKIHNDGTGDLDVGNYDCEVLLTKKLEGKVVLVPLAAGRVVAYARQGGWRGLVRRVAKEAVTL